MTSEPTVLMTASSNAPDVQQKPKWTDRVSAQGGPWDQVRSVEMLRGAPSLPMPVQVAQPETLAPYFAHLKSNGTHEAGDTSKCQAGAEPYYQVPLIEFEKGVVYADRRLDLCKMVVGPLNIGPLMDSLEENTFIEHFLLGNNIVGPAGARRIAKFIHDHPDRMDTWYLAGNCIDATGWKAMVDGLLKSRATNVWLKRNPLGAGAAQDVARYILGSEHLRTLDLDQTELGDAGVAEIFDALTGTGDIESKLPLCHLYLNALGIGPKAAASINRFLLSPRCQLQSLYLSNNPLGDDGVTALAANLSQNTSLERLMLSSTGISSTGAIKLLGELKSHSSLIALDLGQSFATDDLGTKYNWLDDLCISAVQGLLTSSVTPIRYLLLGYTAMSHPGMNEIFRTVASPSCSSLCWFSLYSILPPKGDHDVVKARQSEKRLRPKLQARLHENVARLYNGVDYQTFESDDKRWLAGPKQDLRKIDSVYRNRDAGLARRGLKILDKWWKEDDDTLDVIMAS